MSQNASSLTLLTNASGIGPSTLEDFEDAGFESAEENQTVTIRFAGKL